jgi:hypothetical protein
VSQQNLADRISRATSLIAGWGSISFFVLRAQLNNYLITTDVAHRLTASKKEVDQFFTSPLHHHHSSYIYSKRRDSPANAINAKSAYMDVLQQRREL